MHWFWYSGGLSVSSQILVSFARLPFVNRLLLHVPGQQTLGPPLDLIQQLCLVLGAAEWDTVLQIRPHEGRAEGGLLNSPAFKSVSFQFGYKYVVWDHAKGLAEVQLMSLTSGLFWKICLMLKRNSFSLSLADAWKLTSPANVDICGSQTRVTGCSSVLCKNKALASGGLGSRAGWAPSIPCVRANQPGDRLSGHPLG